LIVITVAKKKPLLIKLLLCLDIRKKDPPEFSTLFVYRVNWHLHFIALAAPSNISIYVISALSGYA
jgi:hypothetical protein